jgi:hypothetical protein
VPCYAAQYAVAMLCSTWRHLDEAKAGRSQEIWRHCAPTPAEVTARFVPEIIARCRVYWWNAEANEDVASVVRLVIASVLSLTNYGHCCYGPSYEELLTNNPKSEMRAVQHLHQSQPHMATSHMKSDYDTQVCFSNTKVRVHYTLCQASYVPR